MQLLTLKILKKKRNKVIFDFHNFHIPKFNYSIYIYYIYIIIWRTIFIIQNRTNEIKKFQDPKLKKRKKKPCKKYFGIVFDLNSNNSKAMG